MPAAGVSGRPRMDGGLKAFRGLLPPRRVPGPWSSQPGPLGPPAPASACRSFSPNLRVTSPVRSPAPQCPRVKPKSSAWRSRPLTPGHLHAPSLRLHRPGPAHGCASELLCLCTDLPLLPRPPPLNSPDGLPRGLWTSPNLTRLAFPRQLLPREGETFLVPCSCLAQPPALITGVRANVSLRKACPLPAPHSQTLRQPSGAWAGRLRPAVPAAPATCQPTPRTEPPAHPPPTAGAPGSPATFRSPARRSAAQSAR